MFRPVTKLAVQVQQAERIAEMLRTALRTAMSGRRGPVFVEIPRDVLSERVSPRSGRRARGLPRHPPPPPHPDAIREAVRLLRQAQRPLLLVGGGVSWAEANDLVVRLGEQYAIPMITAYGRNDAVPNAHPLYVGPLGRAGSPEAAAACRRADLILVIGSRLGHFTTHFDHRYIVRRDADRADRHRRPRHRPLLPGGRRHPGRRSRGLPGPARRARARPAPARRRPSGGGRPRRSASSARRGWPRRPRSTPRR